MKVDAPFLFSLAYVTCAMPDNFTLSATDSHLFEKKKKHLAQNERRYPMTFSVRPICIIQTEQI